MSEAGDSQERNRMIREKLALQVKDDQRESYYIRSAVDNLRYALTHRRGMKTAAAGMETDLSYGLAWYTKAIKGLYCNSKKPIFETVREVQETAFDMARTIRAGKELSLFNLGLPREVVEAALTHFFEELQQRLNNPENYDPVEAVALIEYRMRYAGPFFCTEDRRLSEGLGAFFLMRGGGLQLPDYCERDMLREATKRLPTAKENAQAALAELRKGIEELRREQAYNSWVEAFRAQFTALKEARPEHATSEFINPWKIGQTFDHNQTVYDRANVTRDRDQIDSIRNATGSWAEDIVVFKPERMALHETIAAAVSRIQMSDPPRFLKELLDSEEGLFQKNILPEVKALNDRFGQDQLAFEEYVDYIMDDHFHIVNPNLEIREILHLHKEAIVARILHEDHKYPVRYDPRLVESREVLLHLVADELSRRHYRKEVRKIVDSHINKYLDNSPPTLALPLKPNHGRIAWVAAGGPAAGKSSLANLILREYRQLGHDSQLCQVNPDHYRALLLPKGDKPEDNVHHGSRTHSESLHVRNLVMERLEEMIKKNAGRGHAPDFWISTMAPSPERMDLASEGGAKVNVCLVSCPVEGDNGAVMRAHRRALNSEPANEDYHRFMPTKALLKGHREASTALPHAIGERRRDLRLFSTVSDPASLIATMDSHNHEMRVFDPNAFIAFIRKSFINIDATAQDHVYPPNKNENEDLAKALCQYLDKEVSLNFRYHEQYAGNPMIGHMTAEMNKEIDKAKGSKKEEKEATAAKRASRNRYWHRVESWFTLGL